MASHSHSHSRSHSPHYHSHNNFVPAPSFRFEPVVYHDIDKWARAVIAMEDERAKKLNKPPEHERVIGIYRNFADSALLNADIAREEADIASEKVDIARMAGKPTALLALLNEDAESRAREANDLNQKFLTYERDARALEEFTGNKPRIMGPIATKSKQLRDLVIAERREKLAEKRRENAKARESLRKQRELLLMVQGPSSSVHHPYGPYGGSRRRNKTSKNSKKRSKKSNRRK